jgi:6-pyruvoyltetrahydropterin/6-carboxytetrahydropterin synthase
MGMFITRKAEFSASHLCRVSTLSEEQNRELFGDEANPNGHGHNYVVEVTVAGEPDPVTGMIIDLKELKDMIEDEVTGPMDHRFLNYEVEPFSTVVPTTPNVAREIWRRMDKRLSGRGGELAKVRLFETPDLYVDVTREDISA